MLIQQGDVLIKKAASIPVGAKVVERKPRGFVLAEGEVTGHAHTIEEEVELFEKDGTLYLKVKDAPVTVKHEEHGHVEVPAGIYEIGIVKEYDHFAEEARAVQD